MALARLARGALPTSRHIPSLSPPLPTLPQEEEERRERIAAASQLLAIEQSKGQNFEKQSREWERTENKLKDEIEKLEKELKKNGKTIKVGYCRRLLT